MSDYKFEGIALGLSILAGLAVAGLAVYLTDQYKARHEPKVLTQEQVKQPETVAREIHVTQPAAQTIVREIEKSSGSTPSVTYYVQAPTAQKAAETTAKQIESKDKSLPAKALEESDRTIVTPDEPLNKVDVYKINLRKAHKVKTGVSYVYDKSYFTAGYQAGRFEGLAYFDWNGKPKGGSVLYTVFEW
jgi:hypothetical protein